MIKAAASFLSLMFICVLSKAQNNGGNVDYEKIHFGFTFQYVSSEYKIYKNQDWNTRLYQTPEGTYIPDLQGATLMAVSSPKSPGFALGFVSDLRAGTHANVRFTPVLTFGDRQLQYEYKGAAEPLYTTKTGATTVDFPLGLKLKSDQIGNFRAYIIGGLKYSLDITSKKKTDNATIENELAKVVKFNRKYLSWETGIGFDLYFEYFKMSPEIKFTQSFNSILDKNDRPNVYSQPLDKLFLRNFQFSLYFE